jgi:hypothetical protein
MGRLDLIDDWIALAREARYSSERLARICEVSGSQLRLFFMIRSIVHRKTGSTNYAGGMRWNSSAGVKWSKKSQPS